jgi:hypothetical protein
MASGISLELLQLHELYHPDMCKRCDAILEHPCTTKKDANGRVGRHGTTTITRHLQTSVCQKAARVRQQRGALKGFLYSVCKSLSFFEKSHPVISIEAGLSSRSTVLARVLGGETFTVYHH